MSSSTGPKKVISQRRRLQNQQAQKTYRQRKKRQLELLQNITGCKDGISLDIGTMNEPRVFSEPEIPTEPAQISMLENPPSSIDSTFSTTEDSFDVSSLMETTSWPYLLDEVAPGYDSASEKHPALYQPQMRQNIDSTDSSPPSLVSDFSEMYKNAKDVNDEKQILLLLQQNVSLRDVFTAGLEALSKKHSTGLSPKTPIQEQQNSEGQSLPDKILVVQNQERIISTHMPDIHANHIRLKQFVYAYACMQNAQMIGWNLEIGSGDCDNVTSPFCQDMVSRDVAIASCTTDYQHLKKDLRPSISQLTYDHHPYIDVLPFPTFRERILTLLSCSPPMIDEDELCLDLQNDGIICWGSSLGGGNQCTGSGAPWDLRSWEAQSWFLKKWWIVIGGAEGELYKQSQWWCELRGDKSCYPW